MPNFWLDTDEVNETAKKIAEIADVAPKRLLSIDNSLAFLVEVRDNPNFAAQATDTQALIDAAKAQILALYNKY